MTSFEQLGVFYLGRALDPSTGARTDAPILYDSRDLTTHAVCVGMTGSGKTGLCVTLLEEAAIDGIPAIVIDPKGDLGNLALAFPDLSPGDFRPWIDPAEAARKGTDPDVFAARVAETWREGLAEWDQDGDRIRMYRSAVDLAIYTPGSTSGLPLRALRSFAAPPRALADDTDAMRERISGTVAGLLGLLGRDPDPVRGRDHILISTLLGLAWREGRTLEIADLIREIQAPPVETIGVMSIESFFPARDRFDLAMSLNSLLAAPGFTAWMEGEALDVERLLRTPEGRPRLSVLSIAHMSDAERMFFVTLLLNEVLAWVRSQPGTGSLRALLFMDEVFGFFPPTASPPSKIPMISLLKQARAFGLGIVLATQNPVDLDYKGLSNAGTWFLGRLQTERDTLRVIDGLAGASSSSGRAFDRQRVEAMLGGLKSRVFLMNNVHENAPVLFETRWALSYLRGPLTRDQIRLLTATGRQKASATPRDHSDRALSARPVPAPAPVTAQPAGQAADRPVLPPGVEEVFVRGSISGGVEIDLVYRPALIGIARLHYVDAKSGVDWWEDLSMMAGLAHDAAEDPWAEAGAVDLAPDALGRQPVAGARFEAIPAAAAVAKNYPKWAKALEERLYRDRTLGLWRCDDPKATSAPGETEAEFRVRVGQIARERRDDRIAELRDRYAPRLARIEERIRVAEQRTSRERDQYDHQKLQAAISVGATILGVFLGRKVISAGNIGRASTAARGAARAARDKEDIARAAESAATLRRSLADLDREIGEEIDRIRQRLEPGQLCVSEIRLRPRKSDISVGRPLLAWTPWVLDRNGLARPAFR